MPSAGQFLAVCEILGITDIYSTFIGTNPENKISQLNEEGQEKVLEYIDLLVQSGRYQKPTAEVIPFAVPFAYLIFRHRQVPENFWMVTIMKKSPWEQKFRKLPTSASASVVTAWNQDL